MIFNPTIKKTVRWEPWPYLLDLLDTFESNREVIIGKARQLGISWLVCGYGLWTALFHDNARVLMFSRVESDAEELTDKCRFIFNHLPPFLQKEIAHQGKKVGIEFAENNSKIKAFPSTENAATGYTATLVIRDELDKHPCAKENFASVGPTVDAGGQMIDLSTRDKTKADTHFMDRWRKANTGEIMAKPVFLGWRLRPVRKEDLSLDDWFNEVVKKKYSPFEIEQEYPETQEEFESEAQTVRFFQVEGVDFIRRDCYDTKDTDYNGVVRIWERPVLGRKYASFLDPSDGSDYHAAGWLDVVTNRIVCISHGRTKAEKCAEIFDKYNRLYNNAFNEFELNGAAGLKVAQVLEDLKTPNRRVTGVSRDRKNKYGWWTGGNMSNRNVRNLMLDGLEEVVRNKRMRCHYGKVPNELDSMMRKENDAPRVPRGKHDDLIMMLGGLFQISRESQVAAGYIPKAKKCVGFR